MCNVSAGPAADLTSRRALLHAPPEQGGPPNGATDFRPVDLQAVRRGDVQASTTDGRLPWCSTQLAALRAAADGIIPAACGPPSSRPIKLSLTAIPHTEVAARLLQKQLASLTEGGPLPEATLEAAPESFEARQKVGIGRMARVRRRPSWRLGRLALQLRMPLMSPNRRLLPRPEAASDPSLPQSARASALCCLDAPTRRRASAAPPALPRSLSFSSRWRAAHVSMSRSAHPLTSLWRRAAVSSRAVPTRPSLRAGRRAAKPGALPSRSTALWHRRARSASLIGGLDARNRRVRCAQWPPPTRKHWRLRHFIASVLVSLLDVLPRIESQMVKNGALTVGASLAAADLDAVVRSLPAAGASRLRADWSRAAHREGASSHTKAALRVDMHDCRRGLRATCKTRTRSQRRTRRPLWSAR